MTHFIVTGILFASAVWVAFACVRRIRLMHYSTHDWVTIIAYVLVGGWAATYPMGITELQPFGIVSVAVLFFAGRKRWLTKAPDDTARGTS
jgi:hypothetical protein